MYKRAVVYNNPIAFERFSNMDSKCEVSHPSRITVVLRSLNNPPRTHYESCTVYLDGKKFMDLGSCQSSFNSWEGGYGYVYRSYDKTNRNFVVVMPLHRGHIHKVVYGKVLDDTLKNT